MVSYDSDSSLEDALDYNETGVLLGFPVPDPVDDTISHLGGRPVSRFAPLYARIEPDLVSYRHGTILESSRLPP